MTRRRCSHGSPSSHRMTRRLADDAVLSRSGISRARHTSTRMSRPIATSSPSDRRDTSGWSQRLDSRPMTSSFGTTTPGRPLAVHLIVGARPNFVKVAPLHRLLRLHPHEFAPRLIHTGQHYDAQMSAVFFDDLDIPAPDVHLNVGSAAHGAQTGRIMIAYEPVLLEDKPDLVLVFGDINSTVACALVATKQGVAVGHVEAGLRSFDRTMPEEINRVLTDAISQVLFMPSADADANLLREGVPHERINRVGNIMIDSLVALEEQIERSDILTKRGLTPGCYALLTLHRPSNVDDGK